VRGVTEMKPGGRRWPRPHLSGEPMRRAKHQAILAAAVATIGALASPIAATASDSRCATGNELRGRLTEHDTRCRTARLVASSYFTESPPGEHVGNFILHGFYCEGSYSRSAFHISCRRGRARVWFVGVA
jgi:hypothetical protein